jgi:hypothetical protein
MRTIAIRHSVDFAERITTFHLNHRVVPNTARDPSNGWFQSMNGCLAMMNG